MSLKNKYDKKDGLVIRIRTLEHSETVFNRYFWSGIPLFNERIQKRLTKKQMARLKACLDEETFINLNPVYLHNEGNTTAKPVAQISASISLSPKTQNQAASRMAQQIPLLVGSIMKLCEKMGVNAPFAAFATLTRPNIDMGELQEEYDKMDRVLGLLRNDLKNSAKGKGGLRLSAADGSKARFLGDLLDIENTVNKKALLSQTIKNMFHLHAHDVLIFDKALDFETQVTLTRSDVPNMTQRSCTMGLAAAELFVWWAKHNPNLTLSPDAFELFGAYGHTSTNGDVLSPQEAFTQAFKEAAKYSIKPDVWKNLPAEPTAFSKLVFAELVNVFYGKTLHRPHGVVASARGFVNFVTKNKLSGAVMNAYYQGQLVSDYVPDLYTNISNFKVQNNVSQFVETRKMTADQALFFNAQIVGNAGFDADLLNHVTFPHYDSPRKNKRVENFKYLLNSLCFTKPGKKGLLNRVQMWRDSLQARLLEAKSSKNKANNYINYLSNKLSDVSFLKAALASNLNKDGKVLSHINWAKRALYLGIFDTMKAFENSGSVKWSDVLNARKAKKPAEIETRLISIFGAKNVCQNPTVSTFVDDRLIRAYLNTCRLSRADLLAIIWGDKPTNAVSLSFYELLDFSNLSAVEYHTGSYAQNDALVFNGQVSDVFGILKNYSDSEVDSVAKLQKIISRI